MNNDNKRNSQVDIETFGKKVYDKIVENSTTGTALMVLPKHRALIPLKKVKKCLVAFAVAWTAATVIASIAAMNFIKNVSERVGISQSIANYKSQNIAENTYRTDSIADGYFYKTDAIADKIQTDQDIFKTYEALSTNKVQNMDEILKKKNQQTFAEYLDQQNLTRDDWERLSEKQLLIDNQQKELNQERRRAQERYLQNKENEMTKMFQNDNTNSRGQEQHTFGGK